jgi:hypothetical protein
MLFRANGTVVGHSDLRGGGRRVSDWIPLNCGDHVREISDRRHVGRVEAIWNAHLVKVRWLDSGWYSLVPIARLKKEKTR